MSNLFEKELSSEKLFSGKIIDLYVQEVELPNGKKSKREVVKHPGAVAVIARTSENKLLLVEQYRKPLERTLVEIPAGKLEEGEEPIVTAKRELEEETGYTTDKLSLLISFYTSPGFADELVHLYLAEDIQKMDVKAELDEDEFVNLMEVTLKEAEQLLHEQRIYDAKTAYAVAYLQLQEAAKK
ncbi:NUDIX domain-containing protein [Bacillus lacus]|uniref:NUDIX domain-containing protein n=1 Tax=Metabacillus lacus TaxID=1983721 RepID=A0A7X2M0L5_9BACI|nr:NUDIX hydrolase [Metabacillus lacus]MRX74318.1 NUDIX domain-containing protein [Metabacillus lacus]